MHVPLYMDSSVERIRIVGEVEVDLRHEAREFLKQQIEQIRAAGGSVARSYRTVGKADEQIVTQAEEIGAGLIVIGSRGLGGVRRALMGSISDSVVRHAHCPVLVVRKVQREEMESVFPTRILLATDGSEEAELALWTAVDLASSTNSELHIATAGWPDIPEYVELLEEAHQRLEREAKQTLDEQVKKIEQAGGVAAKAHFRMERLPGQEITHLADEVDAGLIVMGSRGLGGMRRLLLGSVSDSVVRHGHCPVLIVRQER
jgi:nucleotide-binding universal stress UspA family protein